MSDNTSSSMHPIASSSLRTDNQHDHSELIVMGIPEARTVPANVSFPISEPLPIEGREVARGNRAIRREILQTRRQNINQPSRGMNGWTSPLPEVARPPPPPPPTTPSHGS